MRLGDRCETSLERRIADPFAVDESELRQRVIGQAAIGEDV
jgi:hypothetical protein